MNEERPKASSGKRRRNGVDYSSRLRRLTACRYEKYRELAEKEKGVCFVGRLASYKYFNMDQARQDFGVS